MENDANAFGVGEHWVGSGRGISNWIGLTLGTGVGGCLILQDRLWHGDNLGFAGEIGHMIVQPGGPLCKCGVKGCLEAHSSATALLQGVKDAVSTGRLARGPLYERWQTGSLDSSGIYACAEEDDPLALELFERMGWALGVAIASLFTVLGIRHAIIGGGVSASWNQFIEPLKRSMADHTCMFKPGEMVVLRGHLRDAALLGTARLAFEL
jgi:glucokinase